MESSFTKLLFLLPFSFARPKVSVTMDDLENAKDDDNDEPYETLHSHNAEIPSKLQPSRNCKTQNLVKHHCHDSDPDDPDERSSETVDESHLDDYIDNAVDNILSNENKNSSDTSFNDEPDDSDIFNDNAITDEQWKQMYSEQRDYSEEQPKISSDNPSQEKKIIFCEYCPGRFEERPIYEKHISACKLNYEYSML